ncbi:MAG: dihydrofolate reductase [Planctomycetota bacterium]|mgnify:CR=1 FL=1|nr:dihydrofolate reductase [Planctomycetota bacterium]
MEIVAAITDNFVIGLKGDMPWHLPADLAHFKSLTSGHAIAMGRRTWESINGALPNRHNIVITRQENFTANEATVVHSIEEAICAARHERLFIIGGGEIYADSMEKASRLHLTRIHTTLDGDTIFPPINFSEWSLEASVNSAADEKNIFDLTFETWAKPQ